MSGRQYLDDARAPARFFRPREQAGLQEPPTASSTEMLRRLPPLPPLAVVSEGDVHGEGIAVVLRHLHGTRRCKVCGPGDHVTADCRELGGEGG